MKALKEKTADAARHAKRRLENPLTEAQKAGNVVAEAERQRTIRWPADEKCERLRAKAERRSITGVEELVAEAKQKSLRRKSPPQTTFKKVEKTRVEVERRSVIKLTAERILALK